MHFLGLVALLSTLATSGFAAPYNVRDYGAKGDGTTVDSPSINAAITAAAQAGGGTVVLPAGRYLSFSLRLKSNLCLQFEPGAVLVAAEPSPTAGQYDAAEPNASQLYQDFGHSHWQNSLIWGDGLENVSIVGPGLIDGSNVLTRSGPPARRDVPPTGSPAPAAVEPSTAAVAPSSPPSPPGARSARNMDGLGNKAIALKNCRNVTLRDFSVLNGGHFALLATGVDHLTLDNLKIDTNRDGFDIDACRNVRIANCTVNAPHDDAIVLKSSYALGSARATENVTITNCAVSGYDIGSVLAGTYLRTMERAPDRDGPTGRIKLGTESNGGFRNIVIANCTFERSRGLALETVDGGEIEDVVITGLTLREITNSPIFIRLGNRARGPDGTPIGAIRRVKISHVTVDRADGRFPILLAGLPDHPIEDVTLSDLHVVSRGGFTPEQVTQQPAELVNPFFLRGSEAGVTGPREPLAVPERAAAYPEPSMFGLLPAAALYARHVSNLSIRDVTFSFTQPDGRPVVVLDDVVGSSFDNVRAPRAGGVPAFVLRKIRDFATRRSLDVVDTKIDAADAQSL
ncbi:MAG: glycosyl hydrolase family 28-related protein [Opitutus sp.]